ncbi:MAG: hypothetical protein HY744_26265 [Deltaproteobacteria bacterium]|nr:hypothetical protein [Deltaproteobacteria bacterium]
MGTTNHIRRTGPPLAALLASAAGLLVAAPAAAQKDINPPLPNALLLVDNSGSMEYLPDGTLPKICDPLTSPSDVNRWGVLVNVLTGTVNGASCYRMDRRAADFVAEFSYGGQGPYDYGYLLPYHRMVSNGCVAGPGTAPLSVFDWPAGAVGYHKWSDKAAACALGTWDQKPDGLMDVFRERIRFGMMTFDSRPNAGTGVTAGLAYDALTGVQGMWSYYDNWESGGTAASGNPGGCNKVQPFEVGARNPAAPPWEGRLISMGRWDSPIAEVRTVNDHIQEAIIALRPYGATPLGGMMEDAYTFYKKDDWKDPSGSGYDFGPAKDPFYLGGCRGSFVIVLSDGEPNLDMRPYCELLGGNCPFRKPWEVAYELANPGNLNLKIQTFAIGFGMSSGVGFDCNALTVPTDLQKNGKCDGATGALDACCTLMRVAYAGGTTRAYFADDAVSLKAAINAVLEVIAGNSTSRTAPAFGGAAAAAGDAGATGYQFASSFAPVPGLLWRGYIERRRYVCENVSGVLTAKLQPVDAIKGDDFAKNVNEGKAKTPRKFYTVLGESSGASIYSRRTMRPHFKGPDDGVGLYKGKTVSGDYGVMAATVQSSPAAMELDPLPVACQSKLLQANTPGECAKRVMTWALGGTNASDLPSRSGNEFGAVYHSTPTVFNRPREFLRDEAYSQYAQAKSTRPLMLYTATTDGQLHAFKVAANDPADATGIKGDKLQNNELWSFMPPYVLSGLLGMYPSIQQILLDGEPVVRDVVMERTLSQSVAGGGPGGAEWRTILVAGGRGGGGYYFALDITDPTAPEFLWQLSTDAAGASLFGTTARKPAITNIAYKENGVLKEIAVAILPGGWNAAAAAGDCARQTGSFAHVDPSFQPRSKVRCWNKGPERAVAIVRLKDGEVLAYFRGNAGDGPAGLNPAVSKVVPFDSPITGEPVPYPSGIGRVSDRIYIGDLAGTLWRLSLASPNRTDWNGSIFWDSYPLADDTSTDGQPVDTAPVVGIDEGGNTVVQFSTGDQETFSLVMNMKTRVWSVTEYPKAVGSVPFSTKGNWFIPFTASMRVTGAMSLFDGVTYFATFKPEPPVASACSDGYGSLWGVDYRQSKVTPEGPRPLPKLAVDPDVLPIVYTDHIDMEAGVVVFGVAVMQTPTCYEEASVADPAIGTHQSIGSCGTSGYQLVYQTGAAGEITPGQKTRVSTRKLPPPRQRTIVDSWASIVE